MRDEKRSMFRVHKVILSALSKEFRDIFSAFSASFGDEGKIFSNAILIYYITLHLILYISSIPLLYDAFINEMF